MEIPLPTTEKSDIYSYNFSKLLYRISTAEGAEINPLVYNSIEDQVNPSLLSSGTATETLVVGSGTLQSANFVTGNAGWQLTPTNAEINVSTAILSLDIPDTTTANSFHVDSSGNTWWGAAAIGNAVAKILNTGAITVTSGAIGGWTINATSIYTGTEDHSGYTANAGDLTIYSDGLDASIHAKNFYIDNAGALYCTSATISGAVTTTTGSSIVTDYLSGLVAQANLNVANRGWTQTCAFSVTDADTVAWGAGTFTASDGTAYSIGAGNTGNMTAKTYIYLDTAVSTIAYQTTTTSTTAVGVGKVLIAIAQNAVGEATYMAMQGQGGLNIDAANLVVGTVTTNEIAASTIVGANINTLQISGKTCTFDTGTVGGWTMGASSLTNVSGGNTVTLSTGTTAFLAGPTGAPTITMTTAGAATFADVTITGGNAFTKLDANLPSDANLVGYWNFDEGKLTSSAANPTTYDNSGNGNDGSLYGTMTDSDYVTGVVGTALDFEGTDDYVSIADADNLSFGNSFNDGLFSISAWIYMDDATNFAIIDKYQTNNWEYFLMVDSTDKIYLQFYDTSVPARIGRKYNTAITAYEGQWIHIVTTYDASSTSAGMKIYLNGSRVDDISDDVGTYVAMENLTANVYIGSDLTSYANGKIDEVRIYAKELTAKEVYALYKNPAGNKGVMLPVGRLTSGSIYSKQVTLAVADGTGDSYIAGGNALDLANWRGGDANGGAFILGLDDSVVNNPAKLFMGNYSTSKYFLYDGTDMSLIGGNIIATSGTFGSWTISGNSFSTYGDHILIGLDAGISLLGSGILNMMIGYKAGRSTTSGSGNIFIGKYAGYNNITGDLNVIMGLEAGFYSVGSWNVMLGSYAGYWETGSNKLFIDNAQRANEADGRAKALIYGVFANATADQKITINGLFNQSVSKTPASATAAGTAGDICWDANYIYVAVATNSWKRVAITAW